MFTSTLLTNVHMSVPHAVSRVYDLQFMDKIYDEVAHDSEILSLTYSPEIDGQF